MSERTKRKSPKVPVFLEKVSKYIDDIRSDLLPFFLTRFLTSPTISPPLLFLHSDCVCKKNLILFNLNTAFENFGNFSRAFDQMERRRR